MAKSSSATKPKAACSYPSFRRRPPRPSNTVDHTRSAGIQSNRRARMGFEKGRPGYRPPLSVFSAGAHAMTLSEQEFSRPRQDFGVPALATERLFLRAPQNHDAAAIARL